VQDAEQGRDFNFATARLSKANVTKAGATNTVVAAATQKLSIVGEAEDLSLDVLGTMGATGRSSVVMDRVQRQSLMKMERPSLVGHYM
jgi:hypothetical protein